MNDTDSSLGLHEACQWLGHRWIHAAYEIVMRMYPSLVRTSSPAAGAGHMPGMDRKIIEMILLAPMLAQMVARS